MPSPDSERRLHVSSAFVAVAGSFFVACALLYNQLSVALLVRVVRVALGRPWTKMPASGDILEAQLYFAMAGVALLALRWLILRAPSLERWFRRPAVEKLVLALLALAVPILTLEIALRPFTERLGKETSLFSRDDELGWRMRPSATQEWGGVPVSTNADGLRGPVVPVVRTPDTRRIVWLGDSVTFGYGVAAHEDVFPWRVAALLGETGVAVETVNAGVGGYSPWQEALWLSSRGLDYDPDLVVVGFVLNDVTEKFTLVQFGGQEEARQLRDSYYSWVDRLFAHSALVMQVRNLTREVKAKRRLGDDVRLGAVRQQMLDVETLIYNADQENVAIAWDMTLGSLEDIAQTCRENSAELLLVAFPFALQLDDPVATRAPQDVLVEWSAERDIDCIDLLPVLSGAARKAPAADSLFLDHDHLTVRGHAVVADTLARFILQRWSASR